MSHPAFHPLHLLSIPLPPPPLPIAISTMPPPDTLPGPHSVASLDVQLPHPPFNRVRLFYPTLQSAPPPYASWFPPSSFPDATVTSILNYTRIPLLPLAAPFLSHIARTPTPCRDGGALKPGEYPFVLFSHGLAGSIGGYAGTCAALASLGYVVAAAEHRDGSAFVASGGDGDVDFVHYNPGVHGEFRRFRGGQLEKRRQELQAVERVIRNGEELQVLGEGKVPELKRVLTSTILAGHSFGAATVLSLAGEGYECDRVICLDAWLQPLGEEGVRRLDVDDVLFVDMELSKMTGSIQLRQWLKGWQGAVVEGGMHNNASDFPVRLPKWIAVATGMTARDSDPVKLLQTQNTIIAAFLTNNWDHFATAIRQGQVQGVRLAQGSKRPARIA